MPLTIIEAFACKTVVIASRLGAMENMITPGHNGYLFEPQSEESLKECLEKWNSLDLNQKNTLRLNAFETYNQQYTPEKNITQLLNIYYQVIENKSF